jgi:hypothetical protein
MHVKVQKVHLAGQGAAVAATRKIATLTALTLMVLSYQNCMVDIASTTPGAASTSCSPDAATLTEFQVVESTILQPTGLIAGTAKDACGSCHAPTAASSGKAVFLILGTAGVTDNATSVKNFCTMSLKGSSRLSHPEDGSHSGGLYLTTDIPTYYTLINKYF